MSQSNLDPQTPKDEVLTDEALEGVAGGLSGGLKTELDDGASGKGISGRIKEEFEEGLGNKAYSSEEDREIFGNG
ncbi:MAG: hypothetical protein F6K09_25385 [Merismopedia sp. SIO2A8]|nr:hypothetical protein [Symploca sp. SIO2B6]NET51909.1 hypothetical protein [Merismopedia sp. SIO2A8]